MSFNRSRSCRWISAGLRAVAGVALWLLLSGPSKVLRVDASRREGAVGEDERDREIAGAAGGWGRGALMVFLIGLAVLPGFSPAETLQSASHLLIANLLVLALTRGFLFEHAASVAYSWRDRH